ncbi:hypothetical protein B0T26DRAFT_344029 [Lasiosphaeria miniovina]|uniref:TauD/TfdA-like domain-containing protein n=1 Tax=Lasiosphaeria miniovina TaxID=1954250 RepID=A0AA40DUX0_9PEZI|nr:uncharacterized protein B0T26DRAFT_344029 [Lasiosphaeria miniovina]KAK0712713.1 hypothetical protein B0T26DRAFT_344029 [Lasiosphaeria miniovina]
MPGKTDVASAPVASQADEPKKAEKITYDVNIPYKLSDAAVQGTRYLDYLPTWDEMWFEPLAPFAFSDPGLRVTDRTLPNLLGWPGVTVTDIQPGFASVVEGLQLSALDAAGRDELAYLISQRKVLAFPAQDLIDAGPAAQREFMRHFGKLNYQPVSGCVKGEPAFHVIHRHGNKEEIASFLEHQPTTTLWHQDVSYEIQPPGYVLLGMLEGPAVGGDTVFAAADEGYNRLSPAMQTFIDTLTAVHTSAKMIGHAKAAGRPFRKDPVETRHPIVRVHPVTGRRCLFVNNEFLTRIEGLKAPESRLINDFLVNHLVTGHDFQARVKWQPGTVVMFDNRSLIRTSLSFVCVCVLCVCVVCVCVVWVLCVCVLCGV